MKDTHPLEALAAANAACEQSQARRLLTGLFDEGTFCEIDRLAKDGDGPAEAVAGYGLVDGAPVYAFAQDRDVCCGAVGKAQAQKLRRVYELAAQNGAPVVGLFDSDGAKLGEGVDAMDALSEVLAESNRLSGVVPQIAVVLGACVGSAALIAACSDLVIAVEGADYYLNPGDDNAKADLTAESAENALQKVRELLSFLPANNLAAPLVLEADASGTMSGEVDKAAETVADEGTALPLDETAAFGRIGGVPCGIVTLRGDTISGRTAARAARFVRLCDNFSLPVVTFVDAGKFGCLKGAAKLSAAYMEATTAKVTVVAGRAVGAVYIAAAGKQAGADAVIAWPQAVISPLDPLAAIHLFWEDRLKEMQDPEKDRLALAEEYAKTACSPLSAAAEGIVTDVVTPEETRKKLAALLDMLSGKRVSRLPKKHTNIQL